MSKVNLGRRTSKYIIGIKKRFLQKFRLCAPRQWHYASYDVLKYNIVVGLKKLWSKMHNFTGGVEWRTHRAGFKVH